LVSGIISLIDSSDKKKRQGGLKLWDINKNNLGTFLSSKSNRFPIKIQKISVVLKQIGSDIMHYAYRKKLDDKSIKILAEKIRPFLPKIIYLNTLI